jgi:hypothetical protein
MENAKGGINVAHFREIIYMYWNSPLETVPEGDNYA